MRTFPLEERYETLRIERSGRLLTIVMNRPASLNAADALLHEELAHVFYDVASDPDSDVIVLTGAGRAFSAGGDIPWMQDAIDTPEMFEQTAREAKRIVFSMLDLEKPLIAKVNGHATGLGATLALFCDVVFASEDAKIGDPHVSIGFVAGDGGPAIWPQLIGFHRAKEYLMTGELLPARKAAEIGLINHAVPAAELDATVRRVADTIASKSPLTLAIGKEAFHRQIELPVEEAYAHTARVMTENMLAQDAAEGIDAFLTKRSPVWCGR